MKATNFDLDHPLINFSSGDGNTPFTIRNAVEGVLVLGSNGSGKSSGSVKQLSIKYLENNFGGLILTAKTDEKNTWIEYLKKTNRLQDLILVEPGGEYHFDFLAYEAAQKTGGKPIADNLAHVIETVIESNGHKNKGQASDPFWSESRHTLIVNTIDLCLLAYDTVSVRSLYDIAMTIPQRGQQEDKKPKPHSFGHAFQAAREKVEKLANAFAETLPAEEKLSDEDYYDRLIITHLPEAALFRSLDQFFDQFKHLAEKTRGIVMMTFTNFLFQLLREPIYSLFCRHASNIVPEDCYLKGKIVLLNIPTKLYHEAGRSVQVACKFIFQRAWERRNIADNARPCFLIADEMQEFIHSNDVSCQATARSSRICTLYATQNLSSLYANMGGGYQSEHLVNGFLATIGCKIFHSNTHVQTNKWASELIGSAYVKDESRGVTLAGKFSSSRNTSYKLEAMMRPEKFTSLLTGGPRNNYLVEGVVHLQNSLFHNGQSFKTIIFKQL